jgi:hypothetical protein
MKYGGNGLPQLCRIAPFEVGANAPGTSGGEFVNAV